MDEKLLQLFRELRDVLSKRHPGFVIRDFVAIGTGTRKQVRWAMPDAEEPAHEASKTRRHSSDFRTVSWDGKEFYFTPTQAAIVGKLWEAWEDGLPGLGQRDVLEQVESESKRLRDLFKDSDGEQHPAIDVMIVSKGKGIYSLAD